MREKKKTRVNHALWNGYLFLIKWKVNPSNYCWYQLNNTSSINDLEGAKMNLVSRRTQKRLFTTGLSSWAVWNIQEALILRSPAFLTGPKSYSGTVWLVAREEHYNLNASEVSSRLWSWTTGNSWWTHPPCLLIEDCAIINSFTAI